MAIKLADVLENINSAYPVLDISGGASPVKGIGIFADVAARNLLPATKQINGYIAVDIATNSLKVWNGADWGTATNWLDPIQIEELPEPVLSAAGGFSEWSQISELLIYGNAVDAAEVTDGTAEGAYLMAQTTAGGSQQFKFTLNDLMSAMIFDFASAQVSQGSGSSITAYAGGTSGIIGDLDDDGMVGVSDLLIILGDYGNFADPEAGPTRTEIQFLTNKFPETGADDAIYTIDFAPPDSYTADTNLYLTIGGTGSTYYSILEGGPGLTVDATNEWFQFTDSASGSYELSNYYNAPAGFSFRVNGPITVNFQGGTETITLGLEVKVIGDDDSVLLTVEQDMYSKNNASLIESSSGVGTLNWSTSDNGSEYDLNHASLAEKLKTTVDSNNVNYQDTPGLPIRNALEDTDVTSATGNTFYSVTSAVAGQSGGFSTAQLPVKAYRVRVYIRSLNGTSYIVFGSASLLKVGFNPLAVGSS
jgi:hypothetical protein